MKYLILIALIRSVLEGAKQVYPAMPETMVKVLVFVLSALAVMAYDLNALAEFGMASRWVLFDYAMTIVAVSVAVMVGHDILARIAPTLREKKVAEVERKIEARTDSLPHIE